VFARSGPVLLQHVTNCYVLLRNVTKCYILLRNVTNCYELLRIVAGYEMLVTKCLRNFTKCYFTKLHEMLRNVSYATSRNVTNRNE